MWDTLFTLFDSYGPIPRLLFEDLLPPDEYRTGMVEDGTAEVDEGLQRRIAEYDRHLQGKILSTVTLDPYILLSTEDGVNCRHTTYTMRPWKTKLYKFVSLRAGYGIATADIGRRIGEATIAISPKDARRLYEFLLRMGETKTSAGWIFEARMHQIFQRGGSFKATKLGGSTTITIDIDHKSCKDFSKVSELGSLLRKQRGSQTINPDIIGGYFQPQHCNLRSVNSVAIARFATTEKPVLLLFRMTVSTSHPVKAEGLASIWAEIPEDLRETPPILVFVVPADVANTFSEQTIVPLVCNPPGFDKLEQYVLAVGDEILW
jgi:hypothetical protein